MPLRLGYLIPQFPGQTHIFFWRELEALQARGVQPVLLSTRPPPPGLISHEWSAEAAARTTYLARMDPAAALGGLVRLPPGDLLSAPRGEPRAFLRDMAMSIPAARRLVDHARREGIDHVHAHSCGRAALIAADMAAGGAVAGREGAEPRARGTPHSAQAAAAGLTPGGLR